MNTRGEGTWRLLLEGGVTRTVTVTDGGGSGTQRWRARAPLWHSVTVETPRAAVLNLARECEWVDVVELRGPDELTRAEAAEADVARMTTERDAARAEAAGLRVIVDAVDELAFCDYAAEVESYSETAPGSHAAAQVRAAEAYDALVRMRDAWRETHGAIATPPTVAAESATVAPKGKR